MFMRAETFERRMRILERRRIPVISLNEAVNRFENRDIANAETVITLDDGWASNLSIGLPILEKYGYPACVYATTEHFAAGPEVFNVAVSYMIRRSGRQTFTFEGLHPALDGTYHLGTDPDGVIRAFLVAAEGALSLVERQKLLGSIAASLGLDLSEVLSNDRFRLLTPGEFQELSRRGVDVQLHTHSHHLPDSGFETMAEEIEKNREALRKVIDTVPRHFCYPSGEYSEHHPSWLKKLGIVSATTCDPGLNGADASVMLMKRFVDSDQAADIDFEAEICGVREILRRVRASAQTFPPSPCDVDWRLARPEAAHLLTGSRVANAYAQCDLKCARYRIVVISDPVEVLCATFRRAHRDRRRRTASPVRLANVSMASSRR